MRYVFFRRGLCWTDLVNTSKGPMGAEYDLQTYERLAVEDYTRYIFLELCKIPAAREEFGLYFRFFISGKR
ncbi:hypothetical protein N7527_004681 [Penicillium freii]|nr:hypothetical protein N7527_004681 [Penicillium freii]